MAQGLVQGVVVVAEFVRDSSGEWLGGYARGLGDCNITITELWGILKGCVLLGG
jgi:hypothetical protein